MSSSCVDFSSASSAVDDIVVLNAASAVADSSAAVLASALSRSAAPAEMFESDSST